MLTIPVGMMLNGMLKYVFHRSRPAWDDPILMIGSFGFPSGHAMSATLLYGFLAAFGVRKVQAWRWRVLAVLAAGLLVVLIGFSRLYLGVHYLSDVLAGMAAGSAWLALCLTAVGTLPASSRHPLDSQVVQPQEVAIGRRTSDSDARQEFPFFHPQWSTRATARFRVHSPFQRQGAGSIQNVFPAPRPRAPISR